ncbi:MAG: IPT/TIG domain-containing protein [Bacteroidales bacterium]|nr:IPT/TIG domain-containing protein [Bacteroidales bacterium]
MKKVFYIMLAFMAMTALSCQDHPDNEQKPAPKLLSLIPKAGYPGTEVIISGYGFEEPASVSVDGVAATVKSVTNDRIIVTMPAHALGNAPVTVTTANVTLEGLSFRYAEPVEEEKLAIFSYTPASGVVGDQIAIGGQLFSNKKERNSVTINGKAAEIVSANDTRLVVVLPDNPEGQYPFIVTVDGESVTGPNFTYNKPPELTVYSVTPNTGTAGDIVKIAGICFSATPSENIVTINGVQATVLSSTVTELTVQIPENPKGSYPVVVKVGDKTFEGPAFMYVDKTHTYTVKTMSGSAGRAADANTVVDGGPLVAKFRQPRGVCFLPDGRIAIFDNGNNAIRFMNPATWEVSGSSIAAKSLLNAAWRGSIHGDWIYMASKGNNKIVRYNYKTDAAETVEAGFTGTSPMDVCFDKDGNGYVLVRDGSKAIFKANGTDFSTMDTFATFDDGPLAMEFDPEGNLIVSTNGCQIIGIKPSGEKFVIAGIRAGRGDDNGEPGRPLTAKFGSNLFGITLDADGNIYVADDSFKIIKLIARGEHGYEDAVITTIAGTSGQSGKDDGVGTEAKFNSPGEIRMDPSGKRLIVTEYNAFIIREIVID